MLHVDNWEDVEEAVVENTGDAPVIRGDEHIHTCPFCGKKAHFYVNYAKGLYNCYVCGGDDKGSGSVLKLARLLGVEVLGDVDSVPTIEELDEMSQLISEAADVVQVAGPSDDPNEEAIALPYGFEWLTPANAAKYAAQVQYLVERGIDWSTVLDYRVGIAFRGERVVFPDFNGMGQVRWWQARNAVPWAPPPKYRGPSGNKGGKVGNLHRACRLPCNWIGVAEGPISGIIAGPEFTWLWGKEHSRSQVAALVACHKDMVIAFDGENRAVGNSMALARDLSDQGVRTTILPLPLGHDPASLGRATFRRILAQSLSENDPDHLSFLKHVVDAYLP